MKNGIIGDEMGAFGADVVYHYTSLASMMSILRTHQIWASNAAYLNDFLEQQLLLSMLQREVRVNKWPGLPPLPKLAVSKCPYVASFCGAKDLLSQWRSYCPAANGVCIGFRKDCLSRAFLAHLPFLDKEGNSPANSGTACVFRKVEYLHPDDGQIAHNVLKRVSSEAWSAAKGQDEPALEDDWAHHFFREILSQELCFYKHIGFNSEQEYRLILPSDERQRHQIDMRCTRSSMIPFVRLTVPMSDEAKRDQWNDLNEWDAVAEIVVGPTPNIELTKDSVLIFLASIGRPSVKVTVSSIPYRDW